METTSRNPQIAALNSAGFVHPSQMTEAQRRESNASLHERFARAAERAGGISATRDAPVARAMAKRLREQS